MIIKRIMPRASTAKKRVAAYCRVSTLRDRQDESFETQKKYYEEMIRKTPDWELVRIYADRHSATGVKNRPEFQKMLADAEAKKLDIVICKSISRFARNMVDCRKTIQRFEAMNITVIFEEQNIRTDDPASGFILSLMSAVAQHESQSISRNVQASYASRFLRGEYNLGNNRILGYDSRQGVLVPNQEAWIVQEIFKRFLEGQTYKEISDAVTAMGAKSERGKNAFAVETLRYMLANETYVGDKLLQKQAPQDYLTKRPDKNRPFCSTYLENDHEAIIDRETWNRVQEILKKREKDRQIGLCRRSREHHILYGKLFCQKCGAPFLRRTYCGKKHYKAWNCKERQKGKRGNGCRNVIIKEESLIQEICAKMGCKTLEAEKLSGIDRIWICKDGIKIEEKG